MPTKKKTALTTENASVDYVRDEIKRLFPRWEKVEDCVNGQETIKSKNIKYLPMPNASDKSDSNKDRYNSYLERALFYNVTGYTLAGLLGQIFKSDPVVEVPAQMEVLTKDADGGGVSLNQQAQSALENVLKFARAGLLVDYPRTAGPTTVADQQAAKIRPRIILWNPKDVINWRTVTVGGQVLLSLVVIAEKYVVTDDGFKEETDTQFRVLKLENGIYKVEIWQRDADKTNAFSIVDSFFPTQSNGAPWAFIPFTFIGDKSNEPTPSKSTPLYDLAEINISHYRNSADHEESCYMVGQPTPWVSGVTKDWVATVWKGKLMLGSRAVIPLPESGAAGLLQAEPNTMVGEAMKEKQEQMKALGAKLITPGESTQTATEANINNTSQTCNLAQCANNVSAAYTKALEWAGLFFGATGKTDYELNVDFQAALTTAQDRAELIAEWQAQAISTTEMRAQMKRAGIATQTDEEYKTEIEAAGPNMGLPVDPNQQTTDAANAAAAVADAKAKLRDANQPPAPPK